MDISEAFPTTIKRKPAQLRVLRNNGYCWGRLIFEDGTEFDVDTRRDLYDWSDGDAADALERLARRGKLSPLSSSFLIGWADMDEDE